MCGQRPNYRKLAGRPSGAVFECLCNATVHLQYNRKKIHQFVQEPSCCVHFSTTASSACSVIKARDSNPFVLLFLSICLRFFQGRGVKYGATSYKILRLSTIMDKILGTNLHLWRFFSGYTCSTPPLSPPTPVQCWTRVHAISPEFQHCIGGEGGKQRILKRITVLF